jgi:hypothetical protein
MTSALSQLIVASGEHAEEGGHAIVNELPFDPIFFGVIALAAFAALLLLLLAFRNSLALEPHGAAGVHATADVHGTHTS